MTAPADAAGLDWQRVKELLADALEHTGAEREACLARLAQEPPAVAARVRALLAAEARAAPLPDKDEAWLALHVAPRDWTGQHIGSYRVERFLARGGMGEVYEAVQDGTGRRAALKLLASAALGDRTRFQLEGRLLGRLEHPNIAQVLDADVHRDEDGVRWPYLALEFVDGVPLTVHARRARLEQSAVLELFIDVCRGIEHAHKKGIVHRDLKPDNILVAPVPGARGGGRPKILDFGVAALTEEAEPAAATRLTRAGDLIGTLSYMAPEQVALGAHAVDARTDVHALGVILFELLTGRLPFELTGCSITESLHVLRDTLAPPPSSYDRVLRGDLDTIVATALAKEPDRRYPSVAALAADVEHYLNHEPLTARPASRLYRALKFARRHRGLVAAAVGAAVLLGLGVIGTSLGMVRARAEVRHTREVNAFLGDVLSAPSPAALGREVNFREVLDAYAPAIDERFGHRPESAASLHSKVGWAYSGLGDKAAALLHLERAAVLLREHLGPDHVSALRATREAQNARLRFDEDWPGAVEETRAFAERTRRLLGAYAQDVLLAEQDLASALELAGELDAAIALQRDLLARAAESAARVDPETVESLLNGLATTLNLTGEQEEALELYEDLDRRLTERLGARHVETLLNRLNYATTLSELGRYDEALAVCEELAEPVLERFGADHPSQLALQATRAAVLAGFGRFEEAYALYQVVLAGRERVLGARHQDTLNALNNLVSVCMSLERWEESERWLAELIERTGSVEADGGLGLSARGLRAVVLTNAGRYEEARLALLDVIAGFTELFGPDHPSTLIQRNNLARLLHAHLRQPARAAEVLGEVVATWRVSLPDEFGTLRVLMWNLGRAQVDAARFEAAEATLLEVERLASRDPGAAVDPAAWRAQMFALYDAWDRPERAADYE